MSNKNNEKVVAGADIDEKKLLALFDALPGQEISLERNIYKPESCAPFPIIGYFLDQIRMPDADREENPEWYAFLIELTQPTKVLNRKGEIIVAKPGEEVWLPANFQIMGALRRFAQDPGTVHELAVKPEDKVDIGGGKKMRRFRVKTTGSTRVRTFQYALSDGTHAGTPQLGQGQAQTSSGAVYDPKTGEVAQPRA